jgi:pyruvate/2-oxoglutarate dehydrogenase complex dihydrolipoamide dehydrogenase (E3) component
VAGRLAEAGLSVVGVEEKLLGGECPYWGCVPSKMMIRAANLLAEARRVPGMAGQVSVRPDWAPVAARIRDEATDDWDDRVAVDRFVGKGGTFVRGHGRLVGPGAVRVGGQTFQSRRGVVLATGTTPAIPPIPGLQTVPYWTNREAVEVKDLPASLLVLGGGAVGVELAQVFGRFGVTVTVVEAADRLLPGEEPEAGQLLARVFTDEGIGVHAGVSATGVGHDGSRFTLHLDGGKQVSAERLLVATGRRTDLAALGADAAGLDPAARFVDVDEHLRAGDGLWAVGDVTGRGAFTHVAVYQAGIATRDILGEPGPGANYRALPRVTFTDPEIGSVGLSEHAASEAGITVRVGTSEIPSSARGWIHKAGNDGFIKLVEDTANGELVGATAAGPAGGEVLAALAVAVHARVPTATLRQMIYAYPTFHRAIDDALNRLT